MGEMTIVAASGSSEGAAPPSDGRSVLTAMCLCTVLVVGFVASINLAVPKLAASSLHPSSSDLLWIVDSYVALFACLVVLGGAVGDRYGRKGVLCAGLALFAGGAAVSACAPDVAVMLLGRTVTGVGAAAVLPNSLAVLVHTTPTKRRASAISVWAAMTGVGGAVGNVGGGLILSAGSWRLLFVAAAALAVACLTLVAVVTPVTSRHARHLDPVAAGLLTFGALALLIGIIEGPERGWDSAVVVGGFVAAAALIAAWCSYELRRPEPLLDPRVFAVPMVRGACLGMFVVFFGMFALFFVNASFLQYDHGYGLVRTGLAVFPLTVPLLVGARRVPSLVERWGITALITTAFTLIGGGLLELAAVAQDSSYLAYAVGLVVMGVGVMLALPALTMAITTSLPASRAGIAAGLQSTTRELGSALGVAVIGTVLNARFAGALHLRGARTVASALAAASSRTQHHAVLRDYASSVSTALLVIGVVVLVAGALVTFESLRSSRRAAVS